MPMSPANLILRVADLNIAMQNAWIEPSWIQLGLDPVHISFGTVGHRLIEVGFANINFVNSLALVGAVLYVTTQLVRTIVPLHHQHRQYHVFYRLWRAGRSADNVPSVSPFIANQHRSFAPDAKVGQES